MSSLDRDDGGQTLVEILVALAILGIGVTALMAALGVNASTTVVNRSQAQISSTLLQAAEVVKAMPFTTVCTGSVDWQPTMSGAAVPRDPQFDVRYRTAEVFGSPGTACDPTTGPGGTTHASVRVEVSGDGFAPRHVDVSVRRQLP